MQETFRHVHEETMKGEGMRSFTAKSNSLEMEIEGQKYVIDMWKKDVLQTIQKKIRSVHKFYESIDWEKDDAIEGLKTLLIDTTDTILGEEEGNKYWKLYDGDVNKMIQLMLYLTESINEFRTASANNYITEGKTK